jgi:TP901 family phage tail tape measure protein
VANLGEAYVELRAKTDKFKNDVQQSTDEAARKAEEAAKKIEQAFDARLARVGDRFTELGKKAGDAGKKLTTRLTLPLAAIGGAAFKTAGQFETSMAKIVGLVGVAADEVEAWKGQVRGLAIEYGKSAGEAADALFFITSAGLRGADATAVLEQSLKAAAIGLGDTTTIADLATSALNAYGSATLPAAKATDVMVAAVREGKLEAAELAGSMGKVLPLASAMGVRFDEVGAAFAALSRTGTNASEAATQVRGILASLLKPTKQASDQLSELGLSADGLRIQIREKGLLSVLETLTTAFGDNEEAQARVFGNVRALSGVLDLMGANVETTRQIFDAMKDTTGATDAAFEVMADTAQFKFAQAMAQVKDALIELGDTLSPFVVRIADAVRSITERFKGLSDGQKDLVVKIALVLAALGPALIIFGKFAAIIGATVKAIAFTIAVKKALTGVTVASTAAMKTAAAIQAVWTGAVKLFNAAWAANPLGLVIVAIVTLIGLFVAAYKKLDWFRFGVNKILNFIIGYFEFMVNAWVKVINKFASGINKLTGVFRSVGINIGEIGEIGEVSFGRLDTGAKKATASAADFRMAEEKLTAAQKDKNEAMDDGALSAGELAKLEAELAAAMGNSGTAAGGATTKTDKLTEAKKKAAAAAKEAAKQVKSLREALSKEFDDATKRAAKSLDDARKAFDDFASSVQKSITSAFSFGGAFKTATDTNEALTKAIREQTEAEAALAEARESGDVEKIAEGVKKVEQAVAAVQELGKQPLTFFDQLAAEANKVKTFGELVNRLVAGGLSEDALQQVLSAGVDAGSAIAREILGSADGIIRANTLAADVAAIGEQVGVNAAGKFRQAGVDAAQALVSGIESVLSKYSVALKSKKLTAKQLKALQKQFAVDVEFTFGKSAAVPALANGAVVNRPQVAMIGEAGAEAVIPITRPARALELMEQTGLAELARGARGAAVNIESATFVAPLDADLVAQKVLVAEKARAFAG